MNSTDKAILGVVMALMVGVASTSYFVTKERTETYVACVDLQKEMIKAGITPKEDCKR